MKKSLLVHIGTGKTGSTAIQQALVAAKAGLLDEGVHYWGLNLEGADKQAQLFPWQQTSGTQQLQQLSVAEACSQVREALERALAALPEQHLAVWSNESIYERPDVFIPAIQEVTAAQSISCTVICYVRNHRSYIDSAYKQWGIKHKTYKGRLLGFMEWVSARKQFLSYGAKAAIWDNAFTNRMRLINYDRLEDVVEHFSSMLPAMAIGSLSSRRPNKSPSQSLLALFALHNNQMDAAVSPAAVEALLRRYSLAAYNHELPQIAQIFPDTSALNEAEELLNEDIDVVNKLLGRHNEPQLRRGPQENERSAPVTSTINTSILSMFMRMLMMQEERIMQLEKQQAGRRLSA